MSKQKKPNKLKQSLRHIITKVFDKNSDSTLSHKQVCVLLDIRETALRKLVYTVLQDLSQEGYIKATSHGEFKLNASQESLEGYIDMTQRGAGYVKISKEREDVYIAPQNTNQSLDGDLVKIILIHRGGKRDEGKVIEVLERERTQYVGTIEKHEKFAFLIPDNQRVGTDIYIPLENLKGAKNGEKALVKINVWPKGANNPYGEVLEVLGSAGSNDVEMISILSNQGLEYVFPQEVLEEAEHIKMELDSNEIAKRRDFRNTLTFTIDPFDAKDFDDALSFKELENGNYEIGVHIADVSHYVTAGSAMDKEALKRSNSVYLVDRVIPMLPEQLSNMVCSLRPNEDKFTFSAVFEIDKLGKIHNEWFGKTVIHSKHRFSYEEAQEVIEGKSHTIEKEILTIDKIAKIYRKRRLDAGALNIESEEVRFKLDDTGHPIEVVIKRSKDAHKLIEEFMLLANKHVAQYISNKSKQQLIPFIYRVHDKPDEAKIELFKVFIDKFGYKLDFNSPDEISKSINKLLNDIHLKNEYSLIQTMAIRSMAKATYETDNIGHYGLSFENYTHFTSPIRRYADLMVHRILFAELNGKKHTYGSGLQDIAKRISRMERKAVEAERESQKYFQVLYLQDKVGEEFEGTVSGLAEFGMFVKMDVNQCEGMIPINEIPGEKFNFNPDKFAIIGSKTGKEYNFGDKVKVKIYELHLKKRQVDLELVV